MVRIVAITLCLLLHGAATTQAARNSLEEELPTFNVVVCDSLDAATMYYYLHIVAPDMIQVSLYPSPGAMCHMRHVPLAEHLFRYCSFFQVQQYCSALYVKGEGFVNIPVNQLWVDTQNQLLRR